jgi:crossover junction endodeoxyribonuclease RuvC
MRVLGIDPGLQKTGWGIIEADGNNLSFVACGLIKTNTTLSLPERLAEIYEGLNKVIYDFEPESAAIEKTFVNRNPESALKLGQARGVAMVVPANNGINIEEYAPNMVKKSLVGTGHASKEQMGMMVKTLLPKIGKISHDEADALAIAICHSHHSSIMNKYRSQLTEGSKR